MSGAFIVFSVIQATFMRNSFMKQAGSCTSALAADQPGPHAPARPEHSQRHISVSQTFYGLITKLTSPPPPAPPIPLLLARPPSVWTLRLFPAPPSRRVGHVAQEGKEV